MYGKTMEFVRNRIKIESLKKDDKEKTIRRQSKLTFNGIHKYCTKYDSYTFKQNDNPMDKPLYLGFAVLKFNRLLLYGKYYDNLQSNFGEIL